MRRRPPGATRPDTLFPSPTLFRSDDDLVALLRLLVRQSVDQSEAGHDHRRLRFDRHIGHRPPHPLDLWRAAGDRSEEHTSELQSLMRISYADFCLKQKTQTTILTSHNLHTQVHKYKDITEQY